MFIQPEKGLDNAILDYTDNCDAIPRTPIDDCLWFLALGGMLYSY